MSENNTEKGIRPFFKDLVEGLRSLFSRETAMKFQRNAILTLIGCVAGGIALIATFSTILFLQTIHSAEESQYKLMKSIVTFNVSGAEDRAIARAEMIADLPMVKTHMASQNRNALLTELKEMYDSQKEKYGVDQAQFHTPPAISLLRLNAPEKPAGEDLSSFRPLIVAVNKDKVAKKGPALGRSGPSILGVVPISDTNGNHVGSFEFGIAFGPMLDKVKSAYGLESVVLMEEQPLKETSTLLGAEIFNNENRIGKYVKFHSTNWKLMQSLVTDEDVAKPDLESQPYTREGLGVPYGVVAFPLKTASGKQIGMIVAAKDFSDYRSSLNRAVIMQVTIALFAVILLAGAILIVVRGFLVRPLIRISSRFEALANGDASLGIEEKEEFFTELRHLAEQHERLRQKGNRS